MKYLLDTCVISELIKAKPLTALMDWLRTCDEENLFISVLTLGEIHKGVTKLQTGKRKHILEEWLREGIYKRFGYRILDIDHYVARQWGITTAQSELKGQPIPVIDGLIAATAMIHKCVVVTRNKKDIEKTGVEVFNPWDLTKGHN